MLRQTREQKATPSGPTGAGTRNQGAAVKPQALFPSLAVASVPTWQDCSSFSAVSSLLHWSSRPRGPWKKQPMASTSTWHRPNHPASLSSSVPILSSQSRGSIYPAWPDPVQPESRGMCVNSAPSNALLREDSGKFTILCELCLLRRAREFISNQHDHEFSSGVGGGGVPGALHSLPHFVWDAAFQTGKGTP